MPGVAKKDNSAPHTPFDHVPHRATDEENLAVTLAPKPPLRRHLGGGGKGEEGREGDILAGGHHVPEGTPPSPGEEAAATPCSPHL